MRFCRTEFKNVLKLEWAEEVVVREIVYAEWNLNSPCLSAWPWYTRGKERDIMAYLKLMMDEKEIAHLSEDGQYLCANGGIPQYEDTACHGYERLLNC